ncbi:MAG: NAD(P)/FAD-dependent oxidoreductase [Deltaproteobacteria bacterium]|jgi:glutathione reductase (NADPH)|nr:NAD(P)/FAD-dependent oxidoreductase [Deltaproteobacteria bacterium]
MDAYDVVIVGSGTSGQTAAFDLNEKGVKVAVVEESDRPGGTCALAGCQPKKWFYEAAEAIAKARHLEGKGIVAAPEGNWAQVLEQKRRFTSRIPEGTIKNLHEAGIDFVAGTASFLDDETLSVNGKRIQAKFFVLATGAKPMQLHIAGIEHVLTSDDFLELNMLPTSILFIGGGFISFEFAHFAARMGSTNQRSVILEVSDRPLGAFDAEMVELLVEATQTEGIDIRSSIEIEAIEKHAKGFSVRTAPGDRFETDLVVHGAGRAPDLDTLELDAAGVEYSNRGITVDQTLRTSNRRIFAVGDCAATIQLARVADKEAHVAAENILAELNRGRKAAMDYRAVPAILFTYPQFAMVGQTEAALKQDGQTYQKSFAKNLNWPTYQRVGLKDAAYKILTDANNQILGAHILSDHAAGLINTIKQAMLNETTVDELYQQTIVSPYPTRESDLSYMLKPLLTKPTD